MEALLDLPEQHTAVLTFLLERIPPAEHLWALTGSASLRLQGVDLSVNDLDLQTDAKRVLVLERKLAEFIKVPVHLWETEHTLSYHGRLEINGLQVELLGDIRHRQPDGTWGAALEIPSVRTWVDWWNVQVPVLSLMHEAIAYERMGRLEKAERIRAAIRKETK